MADEKVTVIDAQADIEGRLKGKDAVIHGRFKGEIALAGRLVIAEGSKVEASVTADAVEVAGELKGDLRSRALTLAEKARVQGTIEARVLVVREGAWLSGSVAAGEQKAAPPAHAPAAHAPAEKPAPQPAPAPDKADKGA
jgi:cytoskeletal protein CcmA (bactofilin family)